MKIKYRNCDTYSIDVEYCDDLFCPNCGKKEVYSELGDGDYYQGVTHYCKNCNNVFTLPYCGINDSLEFKYD